jgi:hypothetical protein
MIPQNLHVRKTLNSYARLNERKGVLEALDHVCVLSSVV